MNKNTYRPHNATESYEKQFWEAFLIRT